jgi:hypothetical protein
MFLIVHIFYLGVGFKNLVPRVSIVKATISKTMLVYPLEKKMLLLGAPLFDSGVNFEVLIATVLIVKSRGFKEVVF